jgi:hypothetical protein
MHSRCSFGEVNSSNAEFDLFISAIKTRVALKTKCLGTCQHRICFEVARTHRAIQDALNGYPDPMISSQSRIKIVAERTL